MRDENRNQLKETTSNRMSLLTMSLVAVHEGRWPVPLEAGSVREKPMKMATVKRELTFAMPSRAVTWMLVFNVFVAVVVVVVLMDCDSILFEMKGNNGYKFIHTHQCMMYLKKNNLI